MKTYNDKIIGKNIIVLIVLCLVSSCVDLMTPENNDISSEEIETVEDEINYVDGVLLYGSEMGDYVQILDENTIHLFKDAPKDKFPQVDDIIVYNPGESVTDVFIGRVESIIDEGDKWVIKTQTPSMEDVFEDLSINMEMGVHNTTAIYHASEGDNITSCRVVDNSVWDNITVLYDSANSIREFSSTKASAYNPVDVTVELAVNSKAFEGKIYIRTQGYVYMKNLNDFVMNVSTQIGLNGTLGVGSEGGCEIPLMQAKKGITLCTNKVLALKLKPQLLFLTEGKIRVESALNFEFVNTDIKMSHNKTEGFKNNSIENKHDNYFRLESLHSEGKFGLALNGDLYAVLLNESFFKGGAHLRTGLTLGGEKNVGIQFPGYANFDFMVLAEPFVSMQPFVAHMSAGGLNILKGPEFNASLELFKISLLPDINKVQYESVGEAKLGVNAQVKGSKTSLIVSKQEGIALFKKGEENPDMRGRIMEISSKAQGDGTLFFDLEEGHEYEIAVYVESEKDGFIYGERIPIEKSIREVLEEFYRSTDGDNWLRNDNWCTDAPLYEWYGVSPLHDQEKDVTYYSLYLSGNNLTGNAYLGPNDVITYANLRDNGLSGVEVRGCSALTYLDCSESMVTSLDISDCNDLKELLVGGYPLEYVNVAKCGSLEMFRPYSLDDAKPFVNCSMSFSDCSNLKEIDIKGCSLVDFNLSGIPALESLYLTRVKLSSLNLSDYQKFSSLDLFESDLTSLELSNLPALDRLIIHDANLKTVSVKNCISLEEIHVQRNPLVSVDLSGCISLRYFDFKAEENKTLETLDFSGCSNLEFINVEVNTVSLIDVSGCSKLLGIECGGGLSSTLTIIGDAAFTGGVYCWDGNLTSLDVSSCSGLTWLDCSVNKLTSLNLSGNTGLISLGCWENKLTSLDVSGCSSLKSLDCYNNPLTSLNVSGCTALKRLDCTDTHLNMCITDMYQKLEEFYYDQKYTNYYWTGYINQTLHYTTNQYGWWYPGEPARGYH